MDLLEQIGALKWGSFKTQFQQAFPDKQWEPEHPEMNAVGFHDVYAGCAVFVAGYFLSATGGLGRVVLACSGEPDEALKKVYEGMSEKLTELNGSSQPEQQGDPTAPPEFRIDRIQIWNTATSQNSLSLAMAKSGSLNPGVSVVWGDRKNDPTARRFSAPDLADGRASHASPKDVQLSDAQKDEIREAMSKDEPASQTTKMKSYRNAFWVLLFLLSIMGNVVESVARAGGTSGMAAFLVTTMQAVVGIGTLYCGAMWYRTRKELSQ